MLITANNINRSIEMESNVNESTRDGCSPANLIRGTKGGTNHESGKGYRCWQCDAIHPQPTPDQIASGLQDHHHLDHLQMQPTPQLIYLPFQAIKCKRFLAARWGRTEGEQDLGKVVTASGNGSQLKCLRSNNWPLYQTYPSRSARRRARL